jgi:protein SCO1
MRAALVSPLQHFLSCSGLTDLTRASMYRAGHRAQYEPWTPGSRPRVTEWGLRRGSRSLLAAPVLLLALLISPSLAQAHEATHEERLPVIGPAPGFALTSQDGARVALEDFRGKAVAVTFIYTSCPDTCPLLTLKMAEVQDELGADFGTKVAFVSITVDPEHDTPEVLKEYAEAFEADLTGWAFLTGAPGEIREVVRRYGVYTSKKAEGDVDHTFLTSLVDPEGVLRVQYLGVRFDPDEFRHDLQGLVNEP